MGQLKSKLIKVLSTFKPKRRDKESMTLIKFNVNFLILCLFIYLTMTAYEWIMTGHPNIPEFRQFIIVVIGMTATVTLLSKWLYDADKDGVPDEVKKENERRFPYDPR